MTRLGLVDFRSYPALDLELPAGAVILAGPNGAGKTNLMEALAYLSTLASHRVSADAALVRTGSERAVVRGQVVRQERSHLLEVELVPGRGGRARVDRVPVARPREILGLLTTVLFAPEDLQLIRGEPEGRRRFLDELLTSRWPRYAALRSDYDRVVRQRTALLRQHRAEGGLRSGRPDLSQLEIWDDHLVRLGAELWHGRLALLADVAPLAAAAYAELSGGGGPLSLTYQSRAAEVAAGGTGGPGRITPLGDQTSVTDLAAVLHAHLRTRRVAELERGVTLVGVQRDDLLVSLADLPARGYASHGESWSAVLALRLGAFRLLSADGDTPVLLLDDVFTELDASRRRALSQVAAEVEQVVITAAVADDVPTGIAQSWIRVEPGSARLAESP